MRVTGVAMLFFIVVYGLLTARFNQRRRSLAILDRNQRLANGCRNGHRLAALSRSLVKLGDPRSRMSIRGSTVVGSTEGPPALIGMT